MTASRQTPAFGAVLIVTGVMAAIVAGFDVWRRATAAELAELQAAEADAAATAGERADDMGTSAATGAADEARMAAAADTTHAVDAGPAAPAAGDTAVSKSARPNDRAGSAARPSAGGAGQTADAALAAARQEIATLEQHAEMRHTRLVAQSARRMATAFVTDPNNHDPERGMVLLENFRDVGRGTPAAAFQTLVHAALQGDTAALVQGLTLDDRARARAEVLLAGLPEEARAQLSPEKLAALWFEGTVVGVPAAQIVGRTTLDPTHVMLVLRGAIGNGNTLDLRVTKTGWQIIVPERALEAVQQKVIGSSPPLSSRSVAP